MELTSKATTTTTTTTSSFTIKNSANKNIATPTTTTSTPTTPTMNESTCENDLRKKPQLFHSVSIIVEPVLDDDSSSIPLVLTPSEVTTGNENTIMPSVSPTSPVLDYDDFIFESESQRKKSQEEDEIVQALMKFVIFQ
ncbi:probable serine/threonine-protein kinase DDB_G0275165 isoform X2 [Tetranychus urticae]|uniref:probable serine/threonine-protein kinase DDB_G0275165 isoform X2 n=1 Tax=Tetranychus urticae TaxID=32264 RepID=UPI000D65AE32|nr:probable serine/threonine-protein kinase DDB_G0275165 isoform X2 [Tetranychus urticae]